MTTYVTIADFYQIIEGKTLPFTIHYRDGTKEQFILSQFPDGFIYTREGVTDEYGEYNPSTHWGYMARKPIKKILIPNEWNTLMGVLPTGRGGTYFIMDDGRWEDTPQYIDSEGTEYYTRWADE